MRLQSENRRTPVRNGDAEQWKNLPELYSCVIDILARCECQAGTRSRGVAIDSNEHGSQDQRRSREEAEGHVPGTDQGRCSGLCCLPRAGDAIHPALREREGSGFETNLKVPFNCVGVRWGYDT